MEDEEGFRDFVRMRLAALSRVAYLLTGEHHAAEDLVQSALVKLAGHWKRISRGPGQPEAYMRKVLYHEHISSWRRRRARPDVVVGTLPDRERLADEAGEVVRRLVLRQTLDRLTRKQRAVLVLRFFEDLSEADTAAPLGCSVGTLNDR